MKNFDEYLAEQRQDPTPCSAGEELEPAYKTLRGRLDGMKAMQKPRDPEHISAFLSRLEAVWRRSPDMRFEQLASIVFSALEREGSAPFYAEDDDMLCRIENFMRGCVPPTPGEDIRLMEDVGDAGLLAMATARMAKASPESYVPADQLYAEMGITQADLDKVGEVDID